MFYLFLIFHILIFINIYFLFEKKLRKTGFVLGMMNFFFFILNLLAFSKTLTLEYSSIIFLKEEVKTHVFFNFLWMFLNICYFFYLQYILKRTSKKVNKINYIKPILFGLESVMISFFLSAIMPNQTSFIFFILLLYWVIISIQNYIQKKKNYYLISTLLLLVVLGYSYLTDLGSAKFAIALAGYPSVAYETGLEELKYYEEKNIKKYSPIEEIPLKEGTLGLIEVKKVGFLKFSNIYKA